MRIGESIRILDLDCLNEMLWFIFFCYRWVAFLLFGVDAVGLGRNWTLGRSSTTAFI